MFRCGVNWISKPGDILLASRPRENPDRSRDPEMAVFARILNSRVFGSLMRGLFLSAMILSVPHHAFAASVVVDKPVARIDSLIATARNGAITIEAHGAVTGGGWTRAALKPAKSSQPGDARTVVLEFVAEPPPSNEAVIPGLLPVSARIVLKMRRGIVSVRAISAVNEITTQILK